MAFRPVYRSDDPKWKQANVGIVSEVSGFYNAYRAEYVDPSAGHAVPVTGYRPVSGTGFDRGDLVRLDGSGDVQELSAITDTVKGVALEAVVNGQSLSPQTNRAIVALAQYTHPETGVVIRPRFATTDVNGVTPASTHVGTNVALDNTGGNWRIDVSNTTNQDVEIVDVDANRAVFIVRFLAGVVQ